jgi:hypothetical protein
MKHGLNKINITLFKQQMKWLGGKWVEFYPWVQGSNFTNDIHCDQGWNIDQIFLTYIDYLFRGKNIVKGATQVSGHSLN